MPRLFQLRKDLASLTQGTKSISTYFTSFRGLIDELDSLAPIPKCTCVNSNFKCNNGDKLEQYEQHMKLSQFLMGLNEQFTSTKGQILLIHPLPDLAHAYSMLLQEENQREFANHTGVNTDSFAMNVRFLSNKSRNKSKTLTNVRKIYDPNVVCDHCKLTGHTKEKCFVLHGYPDWHCLYGQPKPKLRTNATNPKRSASQAAPTVANVSATQLSSTNDTTVDLSDQQYQKLLDMFQTRLKTTT
ncbi:hypothetical protein POM88_031901 [Heracleum sosnowskyi]|uniref:Retrotransposon gag domain-containing protein n=1 Tax=Heracleum sosnowskyi TaxID=360622 RepID=A0AAD8MKR8_9APIA|nr:hypothetical protein POM88_031901 [Heracleum sosnowskyi]